MIHTVESWLRASPRAVAVVDASADLAAMLARLGDADVRDLWVVDAGGRYRGHVGLHALARIVLAEHRPVRSRRSLVDRSASALAGDLADAHVRPARLDEAIDAVIHRMLADRLESLAVVDGEGRVIGEVGLVDLIAGARRGELDNL